MDIETKRLLLRNFTVKDVEDVFEYCSQDGVGEMAGWPAHKFMDDTTQVLSNWVQNKQQLAVVWKENGKVIGHIAINTDSEEGRDDTKELGCALNRNYQRRGVMSEAIQAVIGFLFTQNIEFVWACCFQENVASKCIIEKCGFTIQQEGTFYSKSLDKTFKSYEYCITKDEFLHNSVSFIK